MRKLKGNVARTLYGENVNGGDIGRGEKNAGSGVGENSMRQGSHLRSKAREMGENPWRDLFRKRRVLKKKPLCFFLRRVP